MRFLSRIVASMPRVWCAALVVLSLATAARSSAAPGYQNPYLRAGIKLFLDLEYEGALEQFRKAREMSGNSLDEDVAIDLYEGMAQSELRREDEATRAFKLALSLSPQVILPGRPSPKVRALFDRVKRELASVAQPPPPPKSGPPVPTATDVPRAQHEAQQTSTPMPIPPSATAEPSSLTETPTSEVTKPAGGGALGVAPWVLLGVGVVLGGGGGYLGYGAMNEHNAAQSSAFQSDVARHNSNAATEALAANVLYVTAGVALAAAVVTFVVGHRTSATQ